MVIWRLLLAVVMFVLASTAHAQIRGSQAEYNARVGDQRNAMYEAQSRQMKLAAAFSKLAGEIEKRQETEGDVKNTEREAAQTERKKAVQTTVADLAKAVAQLHRQRRIAISGRQNSEAKAIASKIAAIKQSVRRIEAGELEPFTIEGELWLIDVKSLLSLRGKYATRVTPFGSVQQ